MTGTYEAGMARSGSALVPDSRIDVPMPAGAAVPGTDSEIERLRKALDYEIAWRKTAIEAAKAMARRDALRDAAAWCEAADARHTITGTQAAAHLRLMAEETPR